jgi:hypothetical protein
MRRLNEERMRNMLKLRSLAWLAIPVAAGFIATPPAFAETPEQADDPIMALISGEFAVPAEPAQSEAPTEPAPAALFAGLIPGSVVGEDDLAHIFGRGGEIDQSQENTDVDAAISSNYNDGVHGTFTVVGDNNNSTMNVFITVELNTVDVMVEPGGVLSDFTITQTLDNNAPIAAQAFD